MLKVKKVSVQKAREFDIKEIFPDISDILKQNIENNIMLKKEIIDYTKRDRAGIQFNCIRLCNVKEKPDALQKEVDELEYELSLIDEEENPKKHKKLKKELYLKGKELEKLKRPLKYFDDICESFMACPLYQKGIAPIGEKCPFEQYVVANATEGYINDFKVEIMTQNVDKNQISQLVLSDLLIYRAFRAMSATSMYVINEKFTEMGVEYTKVRNFYSGIRTEELRNKKVLLESMLGTKEIRKKYKMDSNKSSIMQEAEKAAAEMIDAKESIKKNKVPTLINVDLDDDRKIVVDAEVVD